MILTTARANLRRSVRDGGSTPPYTDSDCDFAIQRAMVDFQSSTLAYKLLATLSVADNAAAGTITLAGTIHTGDVVTVTTGGNAVAYTVLAADLLLSDVATALAAAINADTASAALVTATASVSVVTLTAVSAGKRGNAITLTAAVTGSGATVTATASGATLSGGTDVDRAQITSGLPSDFRPEYLLSTWIDDQEALEVVEYEELKELRRKCPRTGAPTKIAFQNWTTATLYPTPNADYSLKLWYAPVLTLWTLGTSAAATGIAQLTAGAVTGIGLTNPGSYGTAPTITLSAGSPTATATCTIDSAGQVVTPITIVTPGTYTTTTPTVTFSGGTTGTLQLPDDWLLEIIGNGAAALLQKNQPSYSKEAESSWAKYVAFRDMHRGAGGRGAKSFRRERAS